MMRTATIAKVLLLALALQLFAAWPAAAQQEKKPVMENVFFNVIWGSAGGGVLGLAFAVIGSSDYSQPDDARSTGFTGATIGGLVGLGVGLYLIFQGITFEQQGVTVLGGTAQVEPSSWPALAMEQPPFGLITEPGKSQRITGFQARVLNIRF